MISRGLSLLTVCCLLMLSSGVVPRVAWSQRDAGAKARGDFTFYARSGGSHINAAHMHASHYHGYLRQTQTVSPRVVRMSGSTINHHLDLSQQHLEGMREHFDAAGDQDSLTAVDAIEQHLADAKHHHATAESLARISPDDIDSLRESVAELRVSLDKAITAYGELLTKHGLPTEPVKKRKKEKRQSAKESGNAG